MRYDGCSDGFLEERMNEAARMTTGADGRMAREPGQGLTAAAISDVVRAIATLVVFPAAFLHSLSPQGECWCEGGLIFTYSIVSHFDE
jgi:hypothetical protein